MSAARRLAVGIARVVLATAAVGAIGWLLAEAAPGSPGERAALAAGVLPADDAIPAALREALIAEVAARHRLDRPIGARLGGHLADLVVLDLGTSWRDDRPVADLVAAAAAPTLVTAALALLLAIGLGVGLAITAALAPGGPRDRAIAAACALGLAVPVAWLALAALAALAAGRPFAIAPPSGWGTALAPVLPAAVLAVAPAMVIARHGRAALLDAVAAPWAIAARARGVDGRRLIAHHALRVAAPLLVALLPGVGAYLLGASLVSERVFGVRGLGALLAEAAARGDAPVVVGVAMVAAATIAVLAVVADALTAALDPRSATA
jgi:ABC-type dipeptide/oligopeptide/nickel transport system permease component